MGVQRVSERMILDGVGAHLSLPPTNLAIAIPLEISIARANGWMDGHAWVVQEPRVIFKGHSNTAADSPRTLNLPAPGESSSATVAIYWKRAGS